MGDLLIRNVPEALKLEIADLAEKDRTSLSATAIDILREGLSARRHAGEGAAMSAWDALRPILCPDDDPEAAEAFARTMEDIEAERKRDFGRPVPDFE